MKRPSLPKRRQRRSQLSPYARYQKADTAPRYSAAYYQWKRGFVKNVREGEQ